MNQNIIKTINSIKSLGVRNTLFKVRSRLSSDVLQEARHYEVWITERERRDQSGVEAEELFAYQPKISVLVPVLSTLTWEDVNA